MRYQINLTISDDLNNHEQHMLTGNSLEEVLAKLLVCVAMLKNGEYEKRIKELLQKGQDDDIPF